MTTHQADPALDYRLGWLWLLRGNLLDGASHGFTDCESLRIREHFLSGKNQGIQTSWLVVNGDACDPNLMARSSAVVQSVAVLSSRLRGRRWKTELLSAGFAVREYALLPPENPRVVVPLDRSGILAGLALHRPGSPLARLAMIAARMLAWAGNSVLLRSRVLTIGAASLECSRNVALYLGTPTEDRKTTVLELGAASPTALVKSGCSPAARAAVEHEAEVLELLQTTSVRSYVPTLVESKATEHESFLRQEYRRREFRPSWVLRRAASLFLRELANIGASDIGVEEALGRSVHLAEDSSDVGEVARSLMARVRSAATGFSRIRIHRIHGDFAPWNCAWTAKGFFVFDWERSSGHGYALEDAFYFAIAPEILIRKRLRPVECVRRGMGFAARVARLTGIEAEHVRVYFALWLLGRLTVSPAHLEVARELERSWELA